MEYKASSIDNLRLRQHHVQGEEPAEEVFRPVMAHLLLCLHKDLNVSLFTDEVFNETLPGRLSLVHPYSYLHDLSSLLPGLAPSHLPGNVHITIRSFPLSNLKEWKPNLLFPLRPAQRDAAKVMKQSQHFFGFEKFEQVEHWNGAALDSIVGNHSAILGMGSKHIMVEVSYKGARLVAILVGFATPALIRHLEVL